MKKVLGVIVLIILCTFLFCSDISAKSVKKSVPRRNSFKSYMDYRCIRNKCSKQYKLQKKCKTAKNGIRVYKGCYVIAVGTYYTNKVGTKVDLVMKNKKVVRCIVGDIKANCDTDYLHRQTSDGSVVEFIVDTKKLSRKTKLMGDASYSDKKLKGNLKYLKVYK